MKRNLLLSITLVMVVALLCGCGGKDKKASNASTENNGSSNTSPVKLDGVYVAEDDFYLEGIIIIDAGDKYNIVIKDPIGAYTDTVDESEVTGNKISSSIFPGAYTITADENGIVFNSESLLIEDLKMTKANGKLDGVYQDGRGYLVLYTLKTGKLNMTYINSLYIGETSTLKFENVSISDNKFNTKDISGTVEADVKLDGGLIAKFTDSEKVWNNYSGGYAPVK